MLFDDLAKPYNGVEKEVAMLFRASMLICLLVVVIGAVWAVTSSSPNPTGRNIVPATQSFAPHYSPDGKWIAFLRGADRKHATEIWIMVADGSDARPLLTQEQLRWGALDGIKVLPMPAMLRSNSPNTGHITKFIWLPDSLSLVFQVDGDNQGGGLYGTNINSAVTSLLRFAKIPQITQPSTFLAVAYAKIVYIGLGGYVRIPTDSYSVPTPVLTGFQCADAHWGIDGRTYCTLTPTSQDKIVPSGIYAVEPDGRITPVVTPPAGESSPALSSDGKWLAFLRRKNLVVQEQLTGKEHTILLATSNYRWLPDGRILAAVPERTRDIGSAWSQLITIPAAIVIKRPDQAVGQMGNDDVVQLPSIASLDALDISPNG
ncbi:MAG TPA: hypothetical protein VGL77_20320, partial [Armatimonadota bacterium]